MTKVQESTFWLASKAKTFKVLVPGIKIVPVKILVGIKVVAEQSSVAEMGCAQVKVALQSAPAVTVWFIGQSFKVGGVTSRTSMVKKRLVELPKTSTAV